MKSMKRVIRIMLACILGYLMYPTIQATRDAVQNPEPENVTTYYLPCVIHEHFQAFGGILLKVQHAKTGKFAWLFGKDLGLPATGDTVQLRVDRIAVPFMNGQIYLNRARSDDLTMDREV